MSENYKRKCQDVNREELHSASLHFSISHILLTIPRVRERDTDMHDNSRKVVSCDAFRMIEKKICYLVYMISSSSSSSLNANHFFYSPEGTS